MKKTLAIILIVTMMVVLSPTVLAASGDVIGHIYETDIRAYINGVEVRSYNIGGKTAIVIEDVLDVNTQQYIYNDEYRTLKFFSLNPFCLVEEKSNGQVTPGKVIGNIYETDIKTSIYDVVLPTYNIGGKTAVAIEDLGYDKVFSPIGGKYIWNPEERTICLEFLYQNSGVLAKDKNITITANEDITEGKATFEEVLHCGGGSEYFIFPDYVTDDAEIETVMPIRAGEETIGYYFRRPSKDYKFTAFTYYDPEKLKKAEKNYTPDPHKTREEIISHFVYCHSSGEPRERFDAEEYSFVYISVAGTSWTAYNLVQAYDDGRYIDYADEIREVNRSPRDLAVDKENEKVTFRHVDRYHSEWFTDYEIDLKTGKIRKIENQNDFSQNQQRPEELNYKIHLTDRIEQTSEGEGKFSIQYTPEGVSTSGDAEYFASSVNGNGHEYEILLEFADGNHAGKLIDMFGEISSGNQAVPIHNEEEKYDLVNEKLTITINGVTAQKVAVKRVLWKGEATVYLYPRDLQPCSFGEVKEIIICAE